MTAIAWTCAVLCLVASIHYARRRDPVVERDVAQAEREAAWLRAAAEAVGEEWGRLHRGKPINPFFCDLPQLVKDIADRVDEPEDGLCRVCGAHRDPDFEVKP